MLDNIKNWWCHKVLPLVYTDALSYYEILCKVIAKVNEAITNVNSINENAVFTVNETKPVAGNVNVGTVRSVNDNTPDENGNVHLPQVSGVTSVNGISADVNGNVELTEINETINRIKADSHNVKSYGAVGDGVTNDSAAFNTIINLKDGKPIFIPEGVYNIPEVTFSGNTFLVGYGTIINCKYNDQTFQNIDGSNEGALVPFFRAYGITFKGNNDKALSIKANSIAGVTRCFDVNKCTFVGDDGIEAENCTHSDITNCDFMHVKTGISFLSCTNITVMNCHLFSPIIGINIDKSDTSIPTRLGGESIKISDCTMIDGVTGVLAKKSNYLYVNNSVIDYFNTGIQLIGSRYARIEQTYIGCNSVEKSSRAGYVAPLTYNCVEVSGDSDGAVGGCSISDCEIIVYFANAETGMCIHSDYSTPTSDLDVTGCTMKLETGCLAKYLMYTNNCYGAIIDNNNFISVNNNLTNVFRLDNYSQGRVKIGYNDFTKCTYNNVAITPFTGSFGLFGVESITVTATGNGTDKTNSAHGVLTGLYKGQPQILYSIANCTDAELLHKIFPIMEAYDTRNAYISAKTIDGTTIGADVTVTFSIVIVGV